MTDRTPAPPYGPLEAAPAPDVRRRRGADHGGPPLGGPEGNARTTGLTAAILLVLLAAEGLTLLQLHTLITPHVVIGMVLVPFVLLKLGTTGYRMVRYYAGPGPYRDRGAPPLLLRLLGPVVVLLTLLVFASGVALLLVPLSMRDTLFFVHKASFVLWFGAMTIHVLGHVLETSRLAPADLVARTRRQVRGAGARLWVQAGCLVAGILLAVLMAPTVGPWLAAGGPGSGH